MRHYKIKHAQQVFSGSTAPKLECNVIDIGDAVKPKRPEIEKRPRNNSPYTSHGKPKATPGDPIRDMADIQKAKEFLLNNGKTRLIRLRNYMFFTLGISTGLRGGDLVKIKIGDVITEGGRFKSYISLFEEKTSKHNNPKLNSSCREAIKTYLDYIGDYSLEDYLFKSEKGGCLDQSQIYRIIHSLQTDLGLPYHLSAHSLRKTFGYWTIKMHPDDSRALVTLQRMLNHDSPETTLIYCGITQDDKDAFYDDMDTLFDEATTI